jgi:hypothetical protein
MIKEILITGFFICSIIINADDWEFSMYGIPESKLKTCIPVQAPPGKWGADYHDTMLSREPKNMKVMLLPRKKTKTVTLLTFMRHISMISTVSSNQ